MELDCHFVCQLYLCRVITLSFFPSKHQLADLLTITLSGKPHCDILGMLGVLSFPSNLRGDVEDLEEKNKREEEIQAPQVIAAINKKMKSKILFHFCLS